tara:strand:+ start:34879 stop:35094 length:216 start_codon:yes stop_codon:yes gene_type:complete
VDSTSISRTGSEPICIDNPSMTVLPGSKPIPLTSTTVPPLIGPHLGLIASKRMGSSTTRAPASTACCHTPD